jgi:hypothetical protein
VFTVENKGSRFLGHVDRPYLSTKLNDVTSQKIINLIVTEVEGI